MLTIAPQGNLKYRFYIGADEQGHPYLLGWCLGRDNASLDAARRALRLHTKLPKMSDYVPPETPKKRERRRTDVATQEAKTNA